MNESIQHFVTRSCVRYPELFHVCKADGPVIALHIACNPAPASALVNVTESQSAS